MRRISKIVILQLLNSQQVNGSGLQSLQTEFTESTIQNSDNLYWRIPRIQVFTVTTSARCHIIMMLQNQTISKSCPFILILAAMEFLMREIICFSSRKVQEGGSITRQPMPTISIITIILTPHIILSHQVIQPGKRYFLL